MDINIDIDIDDILLSASKSEKRDLLDTLLEDSDLAYTKAAKQRKKETSLMERQEVLNYLRQSDGYGLKCLLCDTLGVLYCDTERLREELERIITSI